MHFLKEQSENYSKILTPWYGTISMYPYSLIENNNSQALCLGIWREEQIFSKTSGNLIIPALDLSNPDNLSTARDSRVNPFLFFPLGLVEHLIDYLHPLGKFDFRHQNQSSLSGSGSLT